MNPVKKCMQANNISIVTDNLLCSACGACAAICKCKAISLKENISGYITAGIEHEKCVDCGLCLKACPSYHENQTVENINTAKGVYISAYVGHATDPFIRHTSQSGGVVTALLVYLLEKGDIKGAYVNTFDKKTNRPKVIFAQTKEEIIASAGSYYSQSSVANTVLSHSDTDFAAVMLGCQAESLKLAEKNIPLVKRPKYVIGLVCAGQNSGLNIDYLIKKSGCQNNSVKGFRFRSKEFNGWPGEVLIDTDNKKYNVSKDLRFLSKSIFATYRCALCYNKSNVYSDIVCGDPWGLSEYSKKEGNTIVLVRNENGKKLITDAINDGILNLTPLDTNDFFKSISLENVAFDSFCKNSKYAKEQGYALPYEVSENIYALCDTTSAETKKRMDFKRDFYSCNSEDLVKTMVSEKDREIEKELFKLKMNNTKSLVRRALKKIRRVISK